MRRLVNRLITAAVSLFNRNPWTTERLAWVHRGTGRWYDQDGLWTWHASPFLDDPDFQRAYKRAVTACGWDYGIPWRLHTILWAARLAPTEGAFVECGTGRGFMASAICEHLDWSDRPFLLHDTFDSGWVDGRGSSPYYADGPDRVAENFAEWPGVELVVGRVPDTLTDRGPVAFLHIDMNAAEPEAAAVRHFWPAVVPGGVMVFDDYGFQGYDASRANIDRLAAELGFDVYVSPTGQAVVVKVDEPHLRSSGNTPT